MGVSIGHMGTSTSMNPSSLLVKYITKANPHTLYTTTWLPTLSASVDTHTHTHCGGLFVLVSRSRFPVG